MTAVLTVLASTVGYCEVAEDLMSGCSSANIWGRGLAESVHN